jgi:prevent-host-death family protein
VETRPIEEVSVRELSRNTCAVVTRAREHERLIITRHGHPVAVLLSIDDCIRLIAEHLPPIRHNRERALAKRERLRRLLGEELYARNEELELQRMARGRWPLSP